MSGESRFNTIEDVLIANTRTPVSDRDNGFGDQGSHEPIAGRRSLVSKPSRSDSVFRSVSYAAGMTTVGIMLAVGIFLTLRVSVPLSLDATMIHLAQWPVLFAHVTITPPASIEGTDLSPLTRDAFVWIWPFFAMAMAAFLLRDISCGDTSL